VGGPSLGLLGLLWLFAEFACTAVCFRRLILRVVDGILRSAAVDDSIRPRSIYHSSETFIPST
jgi:hypothetical protein